MIIFLLLKSRVYYGYTLQDMCLKPSLCYFMKRCFIRKYLTKIIEVNGLFSQK